MKGIVIGVYEWIIWNECRKIEEWERDVKIEWLIESGVEYMWYGWVLVMIGLSE